MYIVLLVSNISFNHGINKVSEMKFKFYFTEMLHRYGMWLEDANDFF